MLVVVYLERNPDAVDADISTGACSCVRIPPVGEAGDGKRSRKWELTREVGMIEFVGRLFRARFDSRV